MWCANESTLPLPHNSKRCSEDNLDLYLFRCLLTDFGQLTSSLLLKRGKRRNPLSLLTASRSVMPPHIRRGLNVQTEVLTLETEVSSWRQLTHDVLSAVIGMIDFRLCPTRSSFHILYQVTYCSVSTLAIVERVLTSKPVTFSQHLWIGEVFRAVQNWSNCLPNTSRFTDSIECQLHRTSTEDPRSSSTLMQCGLIRTAE